MQQINIKEYFQQQVNKLREISGNVPSLMIIDATAQDPANQIYIRNKIKDFNALGWEAEVFRANSSVELRLLLGHAKDWDAVIVQMPVANGIDFNYSQIPISKDADGLNPMSNITPATVRGIIDYLDECGFNYEGKSAGRSDIVGKPMAKALLRELGYEVLLTSSYFEYYPDAIPCEGASGQCTIDCRMNGCKYE